MMRLKRYHLVAMAAVIEMAFADAGHASATIVTNSESKQLWLGTEVTASSESTQTIRTGLANNAGGSTATVGIQVERKHSRTADHSSPRS